MTRNILGSLGGISFEPSVDPFRPDPKLAPSTDARGTQPTSGDFLVDRALADLRTSGGLFGRQPDVLWWFARHFVLVVLVSISR